MKTTNAYSVLLEKISGNTKLTLFCITLLGASFRLYKLDFQSLWLDELSSMMGSAPWNTFDVITEYCKKDQPPLFFLLLHYWIRLFGYNSLSARLLVSIIGIVGIPVIYSLGKQIGDKNTGLIAAFLLAVNYFHLFFSQDVRFYSLVFLLSALSFLFFIRVIKEKRILDTICYVFFSSCLFYTHYFSLVVNATQFILFLLVVIVYKERSVKFFALAATALVCSVLLDVWWVPQYLSDSKINGFWIGGVSPWFLINFFVQYFEDPVAIAAFLLISIIYLIVLVRKHVNQKTPLRLEMFLLINSIILSYAVPLAYSLLIEPMLIARYTMIAVPAVLIFIAMGIQELLSTKQRAYLLTAVFCSFMLTILVIKGYYSRPHKSQWRELSKIVLSDTTKNYLFYSKYDFYFDSYFVLLTKTNHTQCLYPDPSEFDRQISNAPGVWLLEAHNDGSQIDQSELDLLESKFKKERVVELFEARGVLYTPKTKK